MSKREIPELPKKLEGKFKKPPAPPKYLVGPNGEIVMGSPPKNRPSNAPLVPSASQWSPVRNSSSFQESRGFEDHLNNSNNNNNNIDLNQSNSFVADPKSSSNTIINAGRSTTIGYSTVTKGKEVDSKSQMKSTSGSKTSVREPPKYFGTTYTDPTQGIKSNSNMAFPKSNYVSIPRPYVPAVPNKNESKLLHNRKPNGKIMGDYTKRYADSSTVPYLQGQEQWQQEDTYQNTSAVVEGSGNEGAGESDWLSYGPPWGIGPDTPALQLNHQWSGYWDDEAGAVYYYNEDSGEATWVPPEL